jgi:hypothetical protein
MPLDDGQKIPPFPGDADIVDPAIARAVDRLIAHQRALGQALAVLAAGALGFFQLVLG